LESKRIQRLVRIEGGLKGYLAIGDPAELEGVLDCPFCKGRHRLRLHGWYARWVCLLIDGVLREERLRIRRLLCVEKMKTVSLLPDFCIPRRQYGVEVLGYFLECFVVLKLSYLRALRRVRPVAERHSVVQQLIVAFLSRHSAIAGFMGTLLHRVHAEIAADVRGRRREAARLFLPFLEGCADGASALRDRALAFYQRTGTGFA
jgi:hypothetical protein